MKNILCWGKQINNVVIVSGEGLSLVLHERKYKRVRSASNSRLTTQQERRNFLVAQLLRPAVVKPNCKKEIPPGRSTLGWVVVKSSWLTGSSMS